MRPAGVRERVAALRAAEEQAAPANLALRRRLTEFVHGCVLWRYDDLGTDALVAAYRAVQAASGDPQQRRTGSALENDSFELVARLADSFAQSATADAGRNTALLAGAVSRESVTALTGDDGRDASWRMARRNALESWREGVISPYRAGALLAAAAYHEPDRDRDIRDRAGDLRTQFEDSPDGGRARAETALVDLHEEWSVRR
ncbi:MAG: hypothetical protein ACT4PP_15140 [Sporichthyaceae bacterium]